jgi:hypothetical protein
MGGAGFDDPQPLAMVLFNPHVVELCGDYTDSDGHV